MQDPRCETCHGVAAGGAGSAARPEGLCSRPDLNVPLSPKRSPRLPPLTMFGPKRHLRLEGLHSRNCQKWHARPSRPSRPGGKGGNFQLSTLFAGTPAIRAPLSHFASGWVGDSTSAFICVICGLCRESMPGTGPRARFDFLISARPSPQSAPRGYSRPVAAVASRHQRVAVWPLILRTGSDMVAAHGHGHNRCRRQFRVPGPTLWREDCHECRPWHLRSGLPNQPLETDRVRTRTCPVVWWPWIRFEEQS